MKKLRVGSDFSGVGAFNQALKRLGVDYHEVFACDMDKYARKTFIHNYGEPDYYPENVYEREIPAESLDIYMTSPPCQAFSLAGKRLGKEDKRGILFFNSHEFIKVNKPRYFIFENVKGLLSDDNGRTFNEWVNMLGGKSVNGNAVMFPYDDAVPYHIYWKVLNAKEHGVPQNRERVFIVGIRDDADNTFRFPAEEFLRKRLKDVLEDSVDEKYYLSDKLMTWIDKHREKRDSSNKYPLDKNDISAFMTARYGKNGAEDPYIKVKSATSKGYEEATEGDSINFSVPNSETRRGRVGKGVAQTLDTGCNQGVVMQLNDSSDIHNCITEAIGRQGSSKEFIESCKKVNKALEKKYNDKRLNQTLDTGCNQGVVQVVAFGRSEEEKKRRAEHFKNTGKDSGSFKDKTLIIKNQEYYDTILANPNPIKEGLIGISDGNCPTIPARAREDGSGQPAVMQLNPSKESGGQQPYQQNRVYDSNGISPALNAGQETWGGNAITLQNTYSIRRLTPRECFRLMDFPDTFDFSVVSDSQAYKQAGNSIVVNVLYKILKNLNL